MVDVVTSTAAMTPIRCMDDLPTNEEPLRRRSKRLLQKGQPHASSHKRNLSRTSSIEQDSEMASVTLRNEMVSIIPGTSENHRPKPGAGAYQNDCGILPSE